MNSELRDVHSVWQFSTRQFPFLFETRLTNDTTSSDDFAAFMVYFFIIFFVCSSDNKRRLPYGEIHRLAHETIDNLDLQTKSLHEVHRAIHYAFTNSYSSDICYPQFSTNHTGCLERYLTLNQSNVVKELATSETTVFLVSRGSFSGIFTSYGLVVSPKSATNDLESLWSNPETYPLFQTTFLISFYPLKNADLFFCFFFFVL